MPRLWKWNFFIYDAVRVNIFLKAENDSNVTKAEENGGSLLDLVEKRLSSK